MSVMSDSVRKTFSYRMHYLLQFCDVIDSMATLATVTAVSVSGTLSVGDKSLGVEALVRIKGRDHIKVENSPHQALFIFMLDLRRRSVITSGSRVSIDCQLT
jgi:hypothetical protein